MAYADFSVAVDRRGKDKGADYFAVRCFGKLVEAAKKLETGTLTLVEGRLEINTYTPAGSKESKKSIRVLADSMRILVHPASRDDEGQ